MSGWVIFAAILISLAGLCYLSVTDPKRRRTHGLPKLDRRPFFWPARLATFGPGVFLTVIGHWSGLTIWAGAVTTLGWTMAAITPKTYAKLRADLRTYRQDYWAKACERAHGLSRLPARYVPERIRAWRIDLPGLTTALMRPTQPVEDIEALKARITALEARLSRLESGDDTEVADIETVDGGTIHSAAGKVPKPLDAAE